MNFNKDSKSIEFIFRYLEQTGLAKLNKHCVGFIEINRLSAARYSASIGLTKTFFYISSNGSSYKYDGTIAIINIQFKIVVEHLQFSELLEEMVSFFFVSTFKKYEFF